MVVFSGGISAGPLVAMTLIVGTTDLDPGNRNTTVIADHEGRPIQAGSGFVAVGAFGDLDDTAIRGAAVR